MNSWEHKVPSNAVCALISDTTYVQHWWITDTDFISVGEKKEGSLRVLSCYVATPFESLRSLCLKT